MNTHPSEITQDELTGLAPDVVVELEAAMRLLRALCGFTEK
jgi:hypothetical protein